MTTRREFPGNGPSFEGAAEVHVEAWLRSPDPQFRQNYVHSLKHAYLAGAAHGWKTALEGVLKGIERERSFYRHIEEQGETRSAMYAASCIESFIRSLLPPEPPTPTVNADACTAQEEKSDE